MLDKLYGRGPVWSNLIYVGEAGVAVVSGFVICAQSRHHCVFKDSQVHDEDRQPCYRHDRTRDDPDDLTEVCANRTGMAVDPVRDEVWSVTQEKGGVKGRLAVWKLSTGEKVRQFSFFGHFVGHFATIALTPERVFVSDRSVMHVFKRSNGYRLHKWANPGRMPGGLDRPCGIAVWENEVFVSDVGACRIQVFDWNGDFLRCVVDQRGSDLGQLDYPSALAFDRHGQLYVADTRNNRIQVFTRDGALVTWFDKDADGLQLFKPFAVCISPDDGRIVVRHDGCRRISAFAFEL